MSRRDIGRVSDKCNQFSRLRIWSLERSCSLLGFHHQYDTYAEREQKSHKMLLYVTGLVFAMVGCSYAAVPLYRRFCQATGYGGTVQRREKSFRVCLRTPFPNFGIGIGIAPIPIAKYGIAPIPIAKYGIGAPTHPLSSYSSITQYLGVFQSVEEKIARHAQDGTITSREIVVQFNADVGNGMPWKFIPTQRAVRVKPGESALAFYTAENRSSTPIIGVSKYNVTPMKAAVYFNKIQCFCFEEQRLVPGEQIDMPVFFYIDPEFETDPRMDGINNLILSYTFFKVAEE